MSTPLSEEELVEIMDAARCAGDARFRPNTLTKEQLERAKDTQKLLAEIGRLRGLVKKSADMLEEIIHSGVNPQTIDAGEQLVADLRVEETRLYHDSPNDEARINQAVRLVERYGGIDGAHHKQWVLNKIVRTLLGANGYKAWLSDRNADPDYSPWDEGIAP